MRARTFTITLSALAAVTITAAILAGRPAEPTYAGRPLSFWLDQYYVNVNAPDWDTTFPAFQKREQAREAIRKIGTNALPFLLKKLNHESPKWYTALHEHPRPLWLLQIADTLSGDDFRKGLDAIRALEGYAILGTNASAAIPDLAIISTNYSRRLPSDLAIDALGYLGAQALPTLLSARSNCPAFQHENIDAALACLIPRILENTDALPFLVLAATDQNPRLRQAASNALARIAPQLATNTPAQ